MNFSDAEALTMIENDLIDERGGNPEESANTTNTSEEGKDANETENSDVLEGNAGEHGVHGKEGHEGSGDEHEEGSQTEAGSAGEGASGGENAEGLTQEESSESPFAGISDETTLTINGQPVQFGELKALAGQAMNLQNVAQQIGNQRERLAGLYQKNLENLRGHEAQAKARWDYMSGLNWLQLKADSTPAEFEELRKQSDIVLSEYEKAKADVAEWSADDALTREVHQAAEGVTQERLNACAAALMDPATGIPGYSVEVNAKDAEFAQKMGVSAEAINGLADPAAWKIIHYARKQLMQEEAFAQKVVPKQNAKGAKPALKGSSSKPSTEKTSNATQRFLSTGSDKDALDMLAEDLS